MPTTSSALGPSSCALGPHATGTQDARHLCNASFTSATIYFPTSDGMELLPSIVIVGGWGCGERAMAAWAPFYASHGIVAMTIGTPRPWMNSPADRCKALLDASMALQSEHGREGSVLHGRLDASRRAVQGYSLGGGGAQLAALTDQTLKCVIAVCPDDGKTSGFPKAHRLSFPSQPPTAVPVLILCGEKDGDAPPKKCAWPHYRQTGATKLIFEVKGEDHYMPLGPAGGTKHQLQKGTDDTVLLCNCLSSLCCTLCCQELPRCWCVPCPFGTLNGPSGHAADHAPRGAIGGVALAWLRLFLQGDENARSQLAIRPDIASGFESSGVAVPLAMDR
jgi:dienelactone hydrolase